MYIQELNSNIGKSKVIQEMALRKQVLEPKEVMKVCILIVDMVDSFQLPVIVKFKHFLVSWFDNEWGGQFQSDSIKTKPSSASLAVVFTILE